MILDRLRHASHYQGLGTPIPAALEFLRGTDLLRLPDGRHPIDGDRLVAIVQRYRTKPPAEAAWEAHRRYIDVQYVVAGTERMGYASLHGELPIRSAYDAEKDVAFFDAQGDLFDVAEGSFVIFMPQDVHAPGLAAGSPPAVSDVFKVVMKCRIEAM